MAFDITKLVRANIVKVKPYSSARDEFSGEAKVFLDANENSLGSPLLKWYNRYPDPYQHQLKDSIAKVKAISAANIFLGNGSDECIDLLFRCFCEPGKDNVIICPPTYGMYEVSAAINDIEVRKAPLQRDFQLDTDAIGTLIDEHTKIIWVCSPNNPSGNSMKTMDIELLLNNFHGLVVVDEAYINFSRQKSLSVDMQEYPNLVVLQTFSKAWGLAGLRLGICLAGNEVITWLNKIKPPYNINQATQDLAIKALEETGQVNEMIREIVSMREELAVVLQKLPMVVKVYPSDANFLLVQVKDAAGVYDYLLKQGIVVRDRSNVQLCEQCLRITIGTEKENTILVDALLAYRK